MLPIRWRKAQLDAVEFVGVNDPAQGSLEVKVRGGETPGELGGKAFVLLEDVGEIENLKYFQFELTLTNSHGLTPLSIQGLRFHFKLGDIKEYHYVGQCSQMAPPGTPGGFWWLLLMALPLGLVLLWSQVAPAQPR